MNTNAQYESCFRNLEPSELRLERNHLREIAEKEWSERIATEKRRRQPRRKNPVPLDTQFVQSLRTQLLEKYSRVTELDNLIQEYKENREKQLNELAKNVQFIPQQEMVLLQTSSDSSYSTQGYGARAYARGVLEPMAEKLKSLGFTVEIRYKTVWTNPNGQHSCFREGGDFQLWANCPDWMYDALKRVISLQEIVATLKKSRLNPLVYYPFLPQKYL